MNFVVVVLKRKITNHCDSGSGYQGNAWNFVN